MQAQEATSAEDLLFRLWPWVEANGKRLAAAAAVVVIVIFGFSFTSYRQNQRELAAGEALTQADLAGGGPRLAEACLKIAGEYPGTLAGRRALLQGAIALFTAGKYADAQPQFQKFIDAHPDDFLTPQATLGLAASLDALGKTDQAVSIYQRAAGQTSDPSVVGYAKFALARIDATQGKLAEAQRLFSDLARALEGTSLGTEAGLRALELSAKLPKTPAAPNAPATTPTPATGLPFNPSK